MFSATREIAYAKSPDAAFLDVQQALVLVGKLASADAASRTVKGSTSYGAQKVRLTVTITGEGEGETATLALYAWSDDIWGVAARSGIRLLLQALGLGDPPAVAKMPRGPRPLEDHLTLGQKISSALFVGLIGLACMDVAWRGFVGLSAEMVWVGSAVLGVVTGVLWVKRRYAVIAAIAGAVAGFTSAWFTIFALERSETTYKIVLLFTVVLGALPGVVVLVALRWLQDRVLPPPRNSRPSP